MPRSSPLRRTSPLRRYHKLTSTRMSQSPPCTKISPIDARGKQANTLSLPQLIEKALHDLESIRGDSTTTKGPDGTEVEVGAIRTRQFVRMERELLNLSRMLESEHYNGLDGPQRSSVERRAAAALADFDKDWTPDDVRNFKGRMTPED